MFGVGKTTHLSALSNWVNGNDAPVVADESPFLNWSDWDAAQRDLFLLDDDLNIVFRGNISGGVPSSLEDWIIELAPAPVMKASPKVEFIKGRGSYSRKGSNLALNLKKVDDAMMQEILNFVQSKFE